MKTLLTALSLALTLSASAQDKPFTLPEVQTWSAAAGSIVPSGTVVCLDEEFGKLAAGLSVDYQLLTGKASKLNAVAKNNRAAKLKKTIADGDIVVLRDPKLADEEYRITIDRQITLEASTPAGMQWAAQTLLQLCESGKPLAAGTIQDKPAYRMRGFMIDCGRKYIPMDYLRQLVRVMAYYKMNTLQVHLNDNGFPVYFNSDWLQTQAAFRLESDYFPGLTATDGHYTKDEFRSFIRYAAELGVEIIPEIDVPAHSLAFTKYRPELASRDYGMDHLDLFHPGVDAFVDSVFTEYLEGPDPVFCCPRVHVGTDEYSNATAELRERFRAFTDHCIRLVEKHGKQAVLWGSLKHAYGETPVKSENVLMHLWSNGFADPIEMKKAGFRLISIPDGMVYIVPSAGYYYDYLDCEFLYNEWGPHRIGRVTLEEQDPAIEGAMFAVWNDHPGNGITVKDIHHRVMPALQAIAEKTWGKPTRSYAQWDALRQPLHEAPGVNYLARLGYAGEDIEVGYPYEVEFTVDCQKEQPGAILSQTQNATFYLADPKTGKLGYEREGYLHTFNYQLPESGTVTLKLAGDNQSLTLYVDGVKKQTLKRETLWVMNEKSEFHAQTTDEKAITTAVHLPRQKMSYEHTLVFPLQTQGRTCRSRVSPFRVEMK